MKLLFWSIFILLVPWAGYVLFSFLVVKFFDWFEGEL